MRIISNFTDFYDAQQKYGSDDRIVFSRKNETQLKLTGNEFGIDYVPSLNMAGILDAKWDKKYSLYEGTQEEQLRHWYEYGLCSYVKTTRVRAPVRLITVGAVVNSQVYKSHILLELSPAGEQSADTATSGSYQLVKKGADERAIFDLVAKYQSHLNSPYLRQSFPKSYEQFSGGKKDRYGYYMLGSGSKKALDKKTLDTLHKKLQTPVFYLIQEGSYVSKVLKGLPMSYFGFASLLKDQQQYIYQEIEYCQANVVQDKNEPPIAIGDEVKLQQHGFDERISFRHRK